MSEQKIIHKALLLGSGGLQIGQAGEFDYSGSQAIKALKEEGIIVVLVNPNIATVQTDPDVVDSLYLLPLTAQTVEAVIEKERPDGMLLGFGGQTALNIGLDLARSGILEKYGVRVLGTSIDSIRNSEDKGLFSAHLSEIGISAPKNISVRTLSEALAAAEQIGFPCMVRTGYALGGLASGIVASHEELVHKARVAFAASPSILIEENLTGWKEVEYEIIRDAYDNAIAICNMENMDPVGVHTGDSIVVAPSQTLTNEEYHALREHSLAIARQFRIIGECNIQFALRQDSSEYRVIEMNARLSRSSALASKATGYPIAFVATKLALGKSLLSLKNPVTRVTSAFFEPALDYCAVKLPCWDTEKFPLAVQGIGPEMKSVGEVMAIGRNFCEALQKAIRMAHGLRHDLPACEMRDARGIEHVKMPTEQRLWDIYACFRNEAATIEDVAAATHITPWFLWQIKMIADFDRCHPAECSAEMLRTAKRLGFSDFAIGHWYGKTADDIRTLRCSLEVLPTVRRIDTLAGEYPAVTNYLYCTYDGVTSDVDPSGSGICILGGGPYTIGSSVEFDWCAVTLTRALRKKGIQTILINCNPETVSTDYNESDRLYFEELTDERVRDIIDFEQIDSCIVSVGGQTPNCLALPLAENGVSLLGTKAQSIDRAEDRAQFSALLDRLGIRQPRWTAALSRTDARAFCRDVGYPVIVRPSYVLSGSSMSVARDDHMLECALDVAAGLSSKHPVLISKFIEGAIEFEIDGVSNDGKRLVCIISEHIEPAGIHSGDATLVYPPLRITEADRGRAEHIADSIARSLAISGPFNIQCLLSGGAIFVIECNLRASRSFPFISKASGINLIDLCANIFAGSPAAQADPIYDSTVCCVKSPQFSFRRLKGADPALRIEMASTGECASFASSFDEALLSAWSACGNTIERKSIAIIAEHDSLLIPLDSMLEQLVLHWDISVFLNSKPERTHKQASLVLVQRHLSTLFEAIADRRIGLVVVLSDSRVTEQPFLYRIRRYAVDYGIPLITDLTLAVMLFAALASVPAEKRPIRSYREYQSLVRAIV